MVFILGFVMFYVDVYFFLLLFLFFRLMFLIVFIDFFLSGGKKSYWRTYGGAPPPNPRNGGSAPLTPLVVSHCVNRGFAPYKFLITLKTQIAFQEQLTVCSLATLARVSTHKSSTILTCLPLQQSLTLDFILFLRSTKFSLMLHALFPTLQQLYPILQTLFHTL